MSEVLDLDSGGQDAAPDTGASDSDATNSVELFELDDTSTSAPSDDAGHSDSATSDFDPAQADWLRVDPNTVPEQYQPLVPLAKNLQQMAQGVAPGAGGGGGGGGDQRSESEGSIVSLVRSQAQEMAQQVQRAPGQN